MSDAGEPEGARGPLLEGRRAASEAVEAAERDVRRIMDDAQGVATDDEHDPEGPGLAVERALLMAALDRARVRLADLDLALDRLDRGTYGDCERCGRPIGAARLAARPTARTCIECAARHDRR